MGAAQRSLVTRPQVLGNGGSEAAIYRRMSSGQWRQVQAGVYMTETHPVGWESDLLAAILAAGDGAAASHRAALMLWQMDGITTGPVELTVPYTHGPVPRGTIVHRTRRPVATTTVRGIPVTTVERTLLDICALLSPLIATKAVESALRKRLTNLDLLYETVREFGGRGVRGTRLFRRILNARRDDTPTGSGSETELLYHLRRHGLPEPVLQHEFTSHDGQRMLPDFYWPLQNKAVEIDGLDAHDSADKLERDLQRQNALLDLGVELRRFSAREVRRNPADVVEEIRRFLTS